MTLGQQTTLSLQITTLLYYLHTGVVTLVEATRPKLKSNMNATYKQPQTTMYTTTPKPNLHFVQVGMSGFIRGAKRAAPRNNWIFWFCLEGAGYGR